MSSGRTNLFQNGKFDSYSDYSSGYESSSTQNNLNYFRSISSDTQNSWDEAGDIMDLIRTLDDNFLYSSPERDLSWGSQERSRYSFARSTSTYYGDYNDVNNNQLSFNNPESIDHEMIRNDFENNGRSLEIEDDEVSFNPFLSSTPTARGSYYLDVNERENRSQRFRKKTKPHKKSLANFCVFCKNNGMDDSVCRTHTVKDSNGRVLCPKLRLYKCPTCGMDGDLAHTKKYCPQKKIITEADLASMENLTI